jgi:DNA-binding NtrC family response regulator
VRVIAASNRDLPELVARGAFREDLFYRLNVISIELPPLRDRMEDVPLLAAAFLERASTRHGIEVHGLPPNVLRILMEHGWPGNVRELGNVVERLVLLAEDGRLEIDDLPAELRRPASAVEGCPFDLPAGGLVWEEVERGMMRQAMERTRGNRAAAARLMGMTYKSFLYRLEKHGMAGESLNPTAQSPEMGS